MSLALIIYLASFSQSLLFLCLVGSVFCSSGSLMLICYCINNESDAYDIKLLKKLIISTAICITLSILIPNEKTIYLMVAANGITDIAKTPEADKARQALNLGLDKIINNLQEGK